MTLIRWDPFRELENVNARLNRMFGDLSARRADYDDAALFLSLIHI